MLLWFLSCLWLLEQFSYIYLVYSPLDVIFCRLFVCKNWNACTWHEILQGSTWGQKIVIILIGKSWMNFLVHEGKKLSEAWITDYYFARRHTLFFSDLASYNSLMLNLHLFWSSAKDRSFNFPHHRLLAEAKRQLW